MAKEAEKYKLTAKKSENFSEWYPQVLINSEFIDYSAVSGCIVLRPDGHFVWEMMSRATDELFKKAGVTNTYFPLLIPEKLLQKEKEHIEHFSVEAAWVTHGGQSELDERLAIRPTSETIMYDSVSKWVRSWRDLPMKLNQWNNVIRWEFKHPTPFIRGREFLWNEGHSIYATEEENLAERDVILGIYSSVLKDYLALPGIIGKKTESEKFAGGVASYSIEHIMPDRKAIQGPDWHYDGQNFAKVFEISFIDKDGKKKYAYQSTYAISTREIGVMVATHGDDRGMVIPPKLARIQLVIVPIYKDDTKDAVLKYADKVYLSAREKFRVYADTRDEYSPGWKFNEWELKGVPIRIEIGSKEMKESSVCIVRRDTGGKEMHKLEDLNEKIAETMAAIHDSLYKRAEAFLKENVKVVENPDEFSAAVAAGGFVQSPWCGLEKCEEKAKADTGAKITNMPLDRQKTKGKECIICGEPAKHIANFARSY